MEQKNQLNCKAPRKIRTFKLKISQRDGDSDTPNEYFCEIAGLVMHNTSEQFFSKRSLVLDL